MCCPASHLKFKVATPRRLKHGVFSHIGSDTYEDILCKEVASQKAEGVSSCAAEGSACISAG